MKEKILFIEIYGNKASITFTENKDIIECLNLELNGYQKGNIIEEDDFFQSFNTPKLQRILNIQNIDKLVFGISPNEIISKTEKSSLFEVNPTKVIEEKDLVEEYLINDIENTLLHSIPLGFVLDNKDLLSNPVGMHARKLESIKLTAHSFPSDILSIILKFKLFLKILSLNKIGSSKFNR